MAVPHRSDVPTFLAPAEARPDYAPGQIIVRFHAEGAQAERATDAFDLLERQGGGAERVFAPWGGGGRARPRRSRGGAAPDCRSSTSTMPPCPPSCCAPSS